MLIHTKRSLYEVDCEKKRVRRIEGANPGVGPFVRDGEWVKYHAILIPREGQTMCIFFDAQGEVYIRTGTTLSVEKDDDEFVDGFVLA